MDDIFLEFFKNRYRHLKENGISAFSFLVALIFHIIIISIGTTHYLGSPLHPERSNQTVQKLEEAFKKKNMRFVYIKDDPTLKSMLKPHPGAPLSDKDRLGSSPNGGKGESWDPYSLGNSPQREYGAPPSTAMQIPPIYGGQGQQAIASHGNQSQGERRQSEGKRDSPSSKVIKEAQKKVEEKPKGIDQKEDEKGIYAKGFENGTLEQRMESQNEQRETAKKNRGQQFGAVVGENGIGSQIGKMYVESLKGGFRNTNASRLNEGAVSFETSGWDLGPYARIVQEKVQSNWRIPGVQEVLRQKGWVAIQFEILKNGTIENIEIIRSSRIPSYDQSAINALRSSNPLPPLPSFVDKDKISGVFRFFYYMWSEEEDYQQ
jgi:TonB family protein